MYSLFTRISLSKKWMLLLLFLMAVVSGLYWNHEDFGVPVIEIGGDEGYYNQLANEYYDYGEFTSFKTDKTRQELPPGYPLFIVGIYKIFGLNNFDAVRLVQVFMFAASVMLCFLLFEEIAVDRKIAFLSALFSAFYYPLAMVAGNFNKEVLNFFSIVLLLLFLAKGTRTKEWRWFAIAAFFLTLSNLINSITLYLSFFFFSAFLIFIKYSENKKRYFIAIALFLFLSLLQPLSVYFFKKESVASHNARVSIFYERKADIIKNLDQDGYWPHFVGMVFGYYFAQKIAPAVKHDLFMEHVSGAEKFQELRGQGHSYDEIAKKISSGSLAYIKKHIPSYAAVTFIDWLQFNGPIMPNKLISQGGPMQNMFINGSHPQLSGLSKTAILLGLRGIYWLFFGFVIYGIFGSRKNWKNLIFIFSLIIYFNLIFSVIFGLARYSVPIYPFYILFFVIGASAAWPRISSKIMPFKNL